jgi:trigger factor
LNGKDALFVTTINYIAEYDYPELTDDFVAGNLSAEYGWNTLVELTEGMRSKLQKEAIQNYIRNFIDSEVTVKSVPDELVEYQNEAMIGYYQQYAGYYGMEFEEFLSSVMGISGIDELISMNYEGNLAEAKYGLVLQAIAEDQGLLVSDEDLKNYFVTYFNTDDYSQYEAEYGRPYLKQFALYQKVLDYIAENAVLS